jgi:sugar phosphate permease
MEANTPTQKNTVATTHASLGHSVGQKSKRIFYYKIAAFFLTALVYSISHASRTVWGYVKPYLSTEDPYYTSGKLGILDFSFMASYAIGQYISGWLGDRVNLKVFVCSGLTCAMTALCLFGCLEGFLLIDSLTIAMFLFIFNGFGQSTVFFLLKCL